MWRKQLNLANSRRVTSLSSRKSAKLYLKYAIHLASLLKMMLLQ